MAERRTVRFDEPEMVSMSQAHPSPNIVPVETQLDAPPHIVHNMSPVQARRISPLPGIIVAVRECLYQPPII